MSPTAVQYGVGPIGRRVVDVAVAHGYEFVGAVDIDPAKAGNDLGDVAGLDQALGVDVTDDPDVALTADPDVVFHSTVSSVADAAPQLEASLAVGADVISTCEELAYPHWNNADVADDLAATAREHGATVLGTGINPGFAMDAMPAVLTTPCRGVERVRVERVQDAAQRRGPLQEKVGAGRSPDQFEREVAASAGHVGLPESVAMLVDALGWALEDVEEDIEPVVSDERVASDHVTVEPGEVAGISQTGRGIVDGEPRLELSLQMYLGAPEPRDEVVIEGTPSVEYRVDGGLHGDVTTPAVVVNAARRVHEAAPGLATMLDLPLTSCRRS